MSQLFSLGFVVATLETFCKTMFNNFVRFMERMLFESYTISSHNNGIYTDQLVNYIENNMLNWQTKSYTFEADPHRLGKLIAGQKILLGTGTYFFWYQTRLFWAYLDCKDNPYMGLRLEASQATFTLKISSFRWDIELLRNLFKDIDKESKEKGASIYYYGSISSMHWERVSPMPKRKMETVILPKDKKDQIINDINHFFQPETRLQYEKKGINYKRGIILYGPPGCGKTSLISANYFGMDVYTMSLESSYLTEEGLLKALARIPGRSIVLFEDIDVSFPAPRLEERQESHERIENSGGTGGDTFKGMQKETLMGSKSGLQMKGFLNAIDGIKSNNNGIVFLFTTNHIEKLDPAILRPGRIDLRIELTYIKEPEIRDMFELYYEPTMENCGSSVSSVSTVSSQSAVSSVSPHKEEAEEAEETEEAEEAEEAEDTEKTEDTDDKKGIKDTKGYSLSLLVEKFKDKKVIPAELSNFLLSNSELSIDKLSSKIDTHKWNEHEQFNLINGSADVSVNRLLDKINHFRFQC